MVTKAPRRNPRARRPASLYEAAVFEEERRHAERLVELKRMKARLALLDEFVPALHAAGVSLRVGDLHDWGSSRLYIGNPCLDPVRNAVVERVLREQGMSEEARATCPVGGYSVDLAKGSLAVHVHVDSHRINVGEVRQCA